MLRYLFRLLILLTLAASAPAAAQFASGPASDTPRIAASLVAEGPVAPGGTITLAFDFRPTAGWHGYWTNPGDAGLGMRLAWDLPPGWTVSEPRYPVPGTLLISGLMNHVYEAPYGVLVTLTAPSNAQVRRTVPIAVDANWLACSDRLCVPEEAVLKASVLVVNDGTWDPDPETTKRFDAWRQALPAPLDSPAHFDARGQTLRVSIPLPDGVALAEPHLFIAQKGVIDPAAPQRALRQDGALVFELQRKTSAPPLPTRFDAVLRLDEDGNGLSLSAEPGAVAEGGTPLDGATESPGLVWLLVSAVLGGMLLNILPCVFPILSLKALALLRHGTDEATARREGLAYTAGTTIAAAALGALLLILRAGGEQVGWAFQLQEPVVIVMLALLAVAVTANLAGLYEFVLTGLGARGSKAGQARGAFATGLLASFVATPCTGPFMAAALGAALLLPTVQALALFAMLGIGLGLPFLLLGFIPPLRRALPRPGPWMARFRQWMALPMGLTALALFWLAYRMGGWTLLIGTSVFAAVLLGLVVQIGTSQMRGRKATGYALAGAVLIVMAVIATPRLVGETTTRESMLDAQPFSEKALADARAAGRPVFVWMTADWCVTCKVNEARAIETEAVRAAFADGNVVVLRGDWTRRDPAITRYLTARGSAGVPLYVWYKSGEKGENLPQLLSSDTLIHRAMGTEPSR
ncbi:protein-disulfide reductase DsbD family protein [Pseudoblastomonas halimionae]|uniref:protein-disulfide reductase DsbD family protein n=1 Tax=Alteriqipengyuania halimionae TaxID=1926630 RepID=UPI002D801BDF|nr:thioredoxin family protein [Alteriqipengyuania halimionae]